MMNISCFLFRSKKKVIYHVGAWSGNFGDSIIQQSIKTSFSQLSKYELDFRYINCQQIEFDENLISEINENGDLLLVGGGGLVFYRPQDNSRSGWQWNIDISLIDTLKIPLVVYGVGYNQFEYDHSNFLPITNQHLQKTVEKAMLFSVRNNGTKKELISRGCDGSKIHVIPDSGMFLTPQAIDIPGLDNKRLKIGINWTTDRENQTFPNPFPETKDRFILTLLELLNYAIETHNAQIVYIGHMGGSFDSVIIEKLENALTQKPLVIDKTLPEIYPASEDKARYIVDIYRQADIVLGMRGHANIVSFGQNTPFIGLGSHRKIRYFLEDINRIEYFYDVRPNGKLYDFDTMKKTLDDIINHMDEQKAELILKLEAQREIFEQFNKKVLSLLN